MIYVFKFTVFFFLFSSFINSSLYAETIKINCNQSSMDKGRFNNINVVKRFLWPELSFVIEGEKVFTTIPATGKKVIGRASKDGSRHKLVFETEFNGNDLTISTLVIPKTKVYVQQILAKKGTVEAARASGSCSID